MTPYRLLEQLLALEQRVRHLYVLLSQRQQFPAELRAVWKAMAEDETHHIVALERSAHLFSVMDFPPSDSRSCSSRVSRQCLPLPKPQSNSRVSPVTTLSTRRCRLKVRS